MRKKGKNCKDERLALRITKEDRERLEYVTGRTGKNMSDILREGLKMQYELAKYEHE